MKTPPLLPSEVLARTMRLGRINGAGVLVIAGAGALACAMVHDRYGAAVGLAISLGGAAEIHGAGLIGNGRLGGMRWLVLSQVYLLFAILGYCYFGVSHINIQDLRDQLTPEMKTQLREVWTQYGMTEEQFFTLALVGRYTIFALVTFFYQGAMALIYLRRRRAITAALSEE